MRAATIRGLSRSPTAGVFSEVNEAFTPRSLPNLAAWFDALDTRTMLSGDGSTITDGGAVALWGDKSGNSGVNCLYSPGANTTANSATLGAIGALGTGNFTVVARVSISSFASGTDLLLVGIGNGANAANLIAKNGTSRVQMSKATVGYVSATNGSNLSAFTTYTVTYTKSGTTGTYYINGVADGTCTDNYDYTANSGVVIGQFNTGVGGVVYQARVYSVALDAAGVLADYNGTVQANCTVNCDFTLAPKKLANGDTFTCATGQTVTLNSSGATGARIAGERDLYQGTLANRPVYLAYAGTKYGYLNGTAGNYFSTPDSATVSVTGDIDLIAYVALADWTPASSIRVISKFIGATNQRSYLFSVLSGGALSLGLSYDGTSFTGYNSTASVAFADGTGGWIRAIRIGSTVKFYTSTDGVTWTQLGADVAAVSTALYDGTATLEVGSTEGGTSGVINGKIYRAQAWSGDSTSGGTLAADFNPALYTSGTTLTASTGEVWTINGGAHIVTRTGLYFDGSNDYLKSAAFSLSQPETVYWTGEQVSWTAGEYLFDGNLGASSSVAVIQNPTTPQLRLFSGANAADNSDADIKECANVTALFSGSASILRVNRGAATTGSAGTNSANGFTIGAPGSTSSAFSNIFVSEVALYSAAHATATQDRMALYAGRRHRFAV